MYKNTSTPSNNIALRHYLSTKNLDFRSKNNSTLGVLIEEIRYMLLLIQYSKRHVTVTLTKLFISYMVGSSTVRKYGTIYFDACLIN